MEKKEKRALKMTTGHFQSFFILSELFFLISPEQTVKLVK